MADEGNDPTPTLTLPDQGRRWRWLGGNTPPICHRCHQEPAVANYQGVTVGWGCLTVLDAQDKKREREL